MVEGYGRRGRRGLPVGVVEFIRAMLRVLSRCEDRRADCGVVDEEPPRLGVGSMRRGRVVLYASAGDNNDLNGC
jgi:hypothetical protein